jgi:hypothetical protein
MIVISGKIVRGDLGDGMRDPILIDRIASGSFLSRPSVARSKLDALCANDAIVRQAAEFERSAEGVEAASTPSGRRRLWDFDTHLHCSIIGTCLSTAELRQIFVKLGRTEATTASEHDLHASGVLLAHQRQQGGKLLHKALDRRHRIWINQFAKAKTAEEVRALWQQAVRRGEIPGAYWATLTHPATTEPLLRDVFAEVHMLSHLVGAANRADIRRLRLLEEAKAELEAKVERQQRQLCSAVVSRDATIRELCRTLEMQIGHEGSGAEFSSETQSRVLDDLAGDLKRRLATAEARCERLERLLEVCRADPAAERRVHTQIVKRERELRKELAEVDTTLREIVEITAEPQPPRLSNLTLLYVGGRQAQIGHLREFAERSGAVFLHHDGGVEERGGVLQGLASRADAVLFPVDYVSHAAMLLVKRICQQSGKPILPLRSAGLTSLCAALNRLAISCSFPEQAP